nr:CinA family protein [Planctomycetota bacterium]
HPVGGVWLAVSVRGRVSQRHVQLRGTRERVQRRAAAQALLLVWDALREQAGNR